jgi:hypothetical protein
MELRRTDAKANRDKGGAERGPGNDASGKTSLSLGKWAFLLYANKPVSGSWNPKKPVSGSWNPKKPVSGSWNPKKPVFGEQLRR